MDFKSVLSALIKRFEENNIRYALMGGFALGLWGVGRTTVDIDLLVNRDDMEEVDLIMKELGYDCKYRSKNVSQYVSPLRIFGEVDFLHAFREASLEMLKGAEKKQVFNSLKINVLRPEDLIGMKLQAIKNNPEREQIDLVDINSLISVIGKDINWSLIEKYAKILDMKELYERRIRRKD